MCLEQLPIPKPGEIVRVRQRQYLVEEVVPPPRAAYQPSSGCPALIRQDCARKLRAVQVSEHFQAILGCLLREDWTTPRVVEMVITPDGHLLGRCDGEAAFNATPKKRVSGSGC